MSITEQVRSDINGAMKARDTERVGALRMVLSELQKAAKEGPGLRQERVLHAEARLRRAQGDG